MTAFRMAKMAEATRLTRLGRLTEAMAVLRGRSTSDSPPDAPAAPAGAPEMEILDLQPPSAPGGAWGAVPQAGPPENGSPAAPGGARRQYARPKGRPVGLEGLMRPQGRPSAPPIPAGARFDEATFTNAAGSRTYKLYVPSGYHGQAVPLIVMLHGCTQSPDDFAAGTKMNAVAEEHVFLVAYPAQPQAANASKCWNWFNAGDQQRGRGEPSLIAGITGQIMAHFSVDEGRVYIAGLSAGGAAAAIMGSAYPDLYAAIGVHSGLACGAAKDLPSAFAAMSKGAPVPAGRPSGPAMPTIVFHGDHDRTVSPINADHVLAQSKGGARLRTIESRGASKGGVGYLRTVQVDASDLPILERWQLHGAGHAWSGGSAAGTYTDPNGPDASGEMVRFFLQRRLASAAGADLTHPA